MYTSKITQNNILEWIKEFIQRKIYKEVASQPYGPLFGIQIEDITDSANIEQLGIILWSIFEEKLRERLFEYIECDGTAGAELGNGIFKVFEKSIFNIKDCRCQTMDRVVIMSGRNNVCAVQFFCKRKLPLHFATTVSIMISISISYLVNVRMCHKFMLC